MENNEVKGLPAYITDKGIKGMATYEEFKQFRYNLQILQASKTVNNRELAEILELRPKRIEDFREGRVPPKFVELRQIASFFNVTLDDLLYKKAVVTFEPLTNP